MFFLLMTYLWEKSLVNYPIINVTIQIKSEQLRNYKLNARFKQNETLEEILEMLAPIVGFTYHMPQSNLIELKQEN